MRKKIKEVMKKVFTMSEIPDDISQKNCEKWSSLNHLNLVVELESDFDISFEPEEIAEMKTLTNIEDILNLKIKPK
jgi:acyl carrier protein